MAGTYIDPVIAERIDRVFADWDKAGSPGAALVVLKGNQVVYKRGYGYANLEYDIPITPSSVFHVASVSKQFAAFAIALLAHEGKLGLDDDIHRYLPEVPDFGQTITVRHLIHHVSGLRDQWELLIMAGWRMDDVITTNHVMKLVRNQRDLNFAPGSEYLYCNTGYTLMAQIVEKVSGQSFREFTTARIFKPLGMERSFFYDDHEELVKNRAYSYAPRDDGFKKSVLSYATVGPTSLFTTAEDLAKWLVNLDQPTVGAPEVIEQMHQRFTLTSGETLPYAFGLSYTEHRGLKLIGHSGADAGYRTYCGRIPEHGIGIVVLTNLGTAVPYDRALRVAEVLLDEHLQPEALAPTPMLGIDPETWSDYLGEYWVPHLAKTATITSKDNRLVMVAADEEETELIPSSETSFYLPKLKDTMTFVRDECGRVTHFTVKVRGMVIPARRIMVHGLSAEQLAEYVGEYYSPELGTTYTLAAKDGQLQFEHRRHDGFGLQLIDHDTFQSKRAGNIRVDFVREGGRVVGLKWTGGRVRSVWFEKVNG